jgi:hypothetical protein
MTGLAPRVGGDHQPRPVSNRDVFFAAAAEHRRQRRGDVVRNGELPHPTGRPAPTNLICGMSGRLLPALPPSDKYWPRYRRRVRYLTPSFARAALRRGSAIEQFLGVADFHGVAAVRWVEVTPEPQGYRISLHTVRDLDDEHFADLSNFPPLDPEQEEFVGQGREVGRGVDEVEAIALAERLTGAAPERWVNFSMAGEEYLDVVRSRRSGGAAEG